jgi:hypothetical protein
VLLLARKCYYCDTTEMRGLAPRCSFCGQGLTDERQVVRSKSGNIICPQCVRLAGEFFDESLGEGWRAPPKLSAPAGAEFTVRPPGA